MARLRCESCGESTSVPRRSASLRCPHCGEWMHVAPWRRLWATEDLLARVKADQDLPEALRERLAKELEGEAVALRAKLPSPEAAPRAPVPPEAAPEPPPIPEPARPVATPAPGPAPVAPPPVRERLAEAKARAKAKAREARGARRGQGPTVWERLGPAFAENLGFGLAAFLIVAGAVYFTTTRWTTMSEQEQLLALVGGLLLLGGLLFGAGKLLNRGGRLPEVERTLSLIVAFLAPIAAVPAGDLHAYAPWMAFAASGLVLVAGFFVTRSLARILDPALTPFVPGAFVFLTALVPTGGWLGGRAPVAAATFGALALLGVAWTYARRVVPHIRRGRMPALWPVILFAFAVAAFGARVAIAARASHGQGTWLAVLGIVVAAIGAALVTVEPALFVRRLLGRRRPAVLLVVAIALGITGTLMAVGDDVGLLVASVLGAYACIRAGLALPVPWFALPGLALSALAYLMSPAPVRSFALQVRDAATEALGHTKLPLGWYGITFLPYVFACAWVGWALLKRRRPRVARVFFAWAFLASLGLSALALFASGDPPFTDLRAPAAVFVAQGLLLLLVGAVLRHRIFSFAGTLGVLAGISCGVLHFDPPRAVAVLLLSGCGLLALLGAVALARRDAAGWAPVRAGVLEAAALLASVLFAVAVGDAVRLDTAPWWHGFAYLLLTALVGLLAFAFRRPQGIALAAVALGVAGARFVVGLAPDAGGDLYLLVLALLSGAVLLTPRVDRALPEALRHPYPVAPGAIGSWTPLGALAIQLLGFLLLLHHVPTPLWTWTLAGGLLAAALVLFVAATREEQPWPLYPAVLEFLAAGVVAGIAWAGGAFFGTGGLAGAAIALVILCVPLFFQQPQRFLGRLATPMRHLLPLLVAAFAVWAFALGVAWWHGERANVDGRLLAAASVAVAVAARLALLRTPGSHALRAAALYAGTLFAPAVAGILFTVDHAPHAWPLAFVGAAAAVWIWAGRDLRLHPPALLHLLLAFGTALALGFQGRGDPHWLLAAFAAVAVGGWIASHRLPTLGWALALAAVWAGVALPLATQVLGWDVSAQPAIALTFAAVVYALLLVPKLGVDRVAARLLADPILALGIVGAVWHAVVVVVSEPPTVDRREGLLASVRWLRYAEAALGLAALVRSLVLPFTAIGRRTLALFVLALAAFAFAPLNMGLHGGDTHFWRPDVELGVLAILLALTTPLAARPRHRDGTGDLGARIPWPILLALVGLALTFAELRDLSTPLTALAATLCFLVLLLRDRGRYLAALVGLGFLGTALTFASWWQPMPGRIQDGVLLLYGAVSAAVAPLLAFAARRLAREGRPDWVVRAGNELYPVGVAAAVLAFGFVGGDVLANAGRVASGQEVLLAAVGLALPGLVALWGALRAKRPHLIHVAVLAALLFYTFLVQRTEHLAFLDGHHLHALVVFGSTLLFLSEFHASPLGRLLAIDGLLLTVPAILRYVPVALGVEGDVQAAWSGLAISAVATAAGARRLAAPFLYGVAAVLVNLMLFSFWRYHGLVDPAFYGIPPGLTLLGAAMLLRGKIAPAASWALIVPGLALLYGSVALQVVRADDPFHALLLFALGLATVALGFALRRNAWLVVGVAVIVLDVVVYLLAHGFQRGFFPAALLVVSGLVVMGVTAMARARRRAREEAPTGETDQASDG